MNMQIRRWSVALALTGLAVTRPHQHVALFDETDAELARLPLGNGSALERDDTIITRAVSGFVVPLVVCV